MRDHAYQGSQPPPRTPGLRPLGTKGRFFYGWFIVVTAWMALLTSYGVMIYSFIIHFNAWSQEFGWGRGVLSGAYSSGLLVLAVTAPAVGKLTDLYGARRVMLVGNLIMGAGVLSLRWVAEPWQLYGAYLLASVGFSAASVVPVNALVARWFERRRGLAIGLAYTGVGIGGVVVTPLANLLIETAGWRMSVTALALLIWAVQVPLVLLVVRSDPYEMGLLPDGRPAGERPATPVRFAKRSHAYAHLPGWSFQEAVRSYRFWAVAIFFFVALTGSNGMFAQIQPIMVDQGYAAGVAALLLSVNGAIATVAKFLYGYLSDRVPIKVVLTVGMGGAMAAPALALGVYGLGAWPWLVLLVPIVLALAATAFSTLVGIVGALAFGLRHIGAISGAIGAAMLLGMAAGPAFVGTLYDVTGSYTVPASILVGAMLAALVLLLAGPSLQQYRVSQAPPEPREGAKPSPAGAQQGL